MRIPCVQEKIPQHKFHFGGFFFGNLIKTRWRFNQNGGKTTGIDKMPVGMLDAQSKCLFRCNLEQIANALCALFSLSGLREVGKCASLPCEVCAFIVCGGEFPCVCATVCIYFENQENENEICHAHAQWEKGQRKKRWILYTSQIWVLFRRLKCFSSSSNVHSQTHKIQQNLFSSQILSATSHLQPQGEEIK